MQFMAPWVPSFRKAIQTHRESHPFVAFSFATVDSNNCPHVRTVIDRGFLFDDKKSNILTFTTDIRMDKLRDLSNNGKFEAVFWFEGTNEQFRVSGEAKVLTQDNVETFSGSIGEYPLVSPGFLKSHSSGLDLSHFNQSQLSLASTATNSNHNRPSAEEWSQELQTKWGELSSNLKSSFRKPQPGSTITAEKQKLLDSLSRGVDGSNEEDGRKNYGLVLMLVDKCDYVNLSGPHHQRWLYERNAEDQWDETELCP
ncbi:hypothetical protein WICPIJ_007933 [Wickerhamomyces pijperi]|uniref:Pyridoxamine 5'-phosphate oxidase Alr4036 family FMN-binding domain-containing protein n=1 Tax=Wickerhamomyces pijperi TaxID=599730 RepID=A0A9P8PZA7_WICPI|nr:hypothetical protein WICPIJ_007933 [Wickerhamomyces pijperi]